MYARLAIIVCAVSILGIVALQCPVEARPVEVWSMERLAESAQVLAVGEVLGTERAGEIAPENTRWGIHLLKMQAKVKVLRAYPDIAKLALGKDATIAVNYEAIDWEKTPDGGNGPIFPDISVGDIYAFPVIRFSESGAWDLVAKEGFGLLIPAVREPLKSVTPQNGVEFMQAELAGTIANGSYTDMHRAGKYLREADLYRSKTSQAVAACLEGRIDEERWLQAAIASYSAMPTPLTSVDTLLTVADETSPLREFVALALSHVKKEGLEERFIAASIRNMGVHGWATAITLSAEYARHPTTVKMLREAFAAGSPVALDVSHNIIKEHDHPLLPDALRAARTALSTRVDSSYGPACRLMLTYGGDEDIRLLTKELRESQSQDVERYTTLWNCCFPHGSKRLIPLIRVVIEDDRLAYGGLLFSQWAASALERVTGEDFGDPYSKDETIRNEAMAKVRAWLAANPDSP